jgi:ribonuclease P protein component
MSSGAGPTEEGRERRRQRFRRRERLSARREFRFVMAAGRQFSAFGIRFRYVRSPFPWSRLGLTVGKRAAAKAVARSRIRRFLREGYRHTKERIPFPADVVAMPYPEAQLTFERARAAFAALWEAMARRPPEAR